MRNMVRVLYRLYCVCWIIRATVASVFSVILFVVVTPVTRVAYVVPSRSAASQAQCVATQGKTPWAHFDVVGHNILLYVHKT